MKTYEVMGSRWEKQDFCVEVKAKNKADAKKKAIAAAQSLSWNDYSAYSEIDSTTTPRIQRDNMQVKEIKR